LEDRGDRPGFCLRRSQDVTEDSLAPGWVVALLVQALAEPFAGLRLDEQRVLAVGSHGPG